MRAFRYPHLISGPRRTPTLNRHLAYLLVIIAGALNAIGFMAVGFYTSHMTGMVADLAHNTMHANTRLVLAGLLAVSSFVTGTVVCTIVFTWGQRRRLASRYANVLAIEGFLMLLVGVLANLVDDPRYESVLVAPLCFTMGLQNALITKIRDFPVRTTHVTGMVTDLGVEIGKFFYAGRAGYKRGVAVDREKLTVLSTLIALFLVGGIVGTAGYWLFDFRALVLGAVLILLASLPSSFRDLSRMPVRVRV